MNGSPVWHPFTQHAAEPAPVSVASAEGAWLTAQDGRRIFDAISSWWVTTHGHRYPRIMAAIEKQSSRLDQVIFAGFTHEAAERTAAGLLRMVPPRLAHVFYSDSGSTAVEVALKMALGYWRNTGRARGRILALENAYHGDTIGTMSAGARGVFNAAYEPLLFEVGRIPLPCGNGQNTLDALDASCRVGDVAAFICEPLILGAGGMLIYEPAALREMHAVCARHDVLFIVDEVMTGFGRTGTTFAVEQAAVAPDIMCVAKGLTGGALPLAATLATSAIFEAHLSKDRARTFFHSSSYTANPIACAAAAANIEIWQTEPVLDRIKALSDVQRREAEAMQGDKRFSHVRTLGTILAADLAQGGKGYLADVGLRLRAKMLERGVLLRPLGNTVYVMPPYCATTEEVREVYRSLSDAVDEVAA